MTSVLTLVAALSFISSVASLPSHPAKVPTCIERLNPFDWTCGEDVEAQSDTEAVALTSRDTLTTSPNIEIVQFADTFANTTPGNVTILPLYPQGFALEYPGFVYSTIKTNQLVIPSPSGALWTDPSTQSTTGRQPGIIRQSNTSSFDLRSLRFACEHIDEAGKTDIPSCLVSFLCQPKSMKDIGIPSGHRPTPRSMVQSTFEFSPAIDQSSLTWPNPSDPKSAPAPRTKSTVYAKADFGDEFYDLDHCSIVLQQFAASSPGSSSPPGVLIDDVIGVAYLGDEKAE